MTAGEGTVAGKTFSAQLFTDQLRMLHTHLRAYNKRRDELLAEHPDTPIFTSFPGIGPVVAATLISEMGEDPKRFPAPGALLAEAGLAPVTRVRTDPASPLPLRRQPPHAPRYRLVGICRRPRRRLVTAHLRRYPRPRPGQVPRSTWTRRPLDPRPLALLDRPGPYDPALHHKTRT